MKLYHAAVESDAEAERAAGDLGERVAHAGGFASFSRNFGSSSTKPTVVVGLPESENIEDYAGELRFFAAFQALPETQEAPQDEQPAQEAGIGGGDSSGEESHEEGSPSGTAADVGDAS